MPLKLTKVKGSQNWYVRGTVAGIGIFESASTSDRAKADAFRARLEDETYHQVKLGLDTREPVVFAGAAESYMNKTGNTRFMLAIIREIGADKINLIDQERVDLGARKIYPSGKNATLVRQFYTPVIAVLNHAATTKMAGAAFQKILKPRIKTKPAEWNTDEYLAKLLPHCNDRLRAIVLFMTDTGVRISEAVRLIPDAFGRKKGYAYIGMTKNGKPRMVPLGASTLAAIKRIMPDNTFDRVFGYTHRTSVNTALKRACIRAGLPKTTPHTVGRHSFSARFLMGGHSLKALKDAGGWETIQMPAMVYGHLEASHVDDAVREVARTREKSVKYVIRRSKKSAK